MAGTDLTILVAFAAGVISFLSPCVLPLVPAYLGQLTAIAVAAQRGGRPAVALAGGAPLPSRTSPGSGRCSRCSASRRRSRPGRWSTTCRPCGRSAASSSSCSGLDLAGLLHIPVLERNWRPLDAGAAGSLATATGSTAFGERQRGPERRRPARWPRRQLARRLARVVRARRDLRDRLEPVHRDHPGRDPDPGRDVRHDGPGRRSCWSPTRSGSGCRSCSSRPSSTARRG